MSEEVPEETTCTFEMAGYFSMCRFIVRNVYKLNNVWQKCEGEGYLEE